MIEFYKKQIFSSMVFILLFSCDVEEKVKGKIDEIDDEYINISGNLSHNESDCSDIETCNGQNLTVK